MLVGGVPYILLVLFMLCPPFSVAVFCKTAPFTCCHSHV